MHEPLSAMPLILTGMLGMVTGFLLGSLGAGGSLLALPAFLYAAKLPVPAAVATSLVVVGLTSAMGGILAQTRCRRRGCPGAEVSGWVALVMALCGLLGTLVGVRVAALLMPVTQQGLLVVVLLAAAATLLRKAANSRNDGGSIPEALPTVKGQAQRQAAGAVVPGFGVGILTGILGVGGGFLLVPALRFATGLTVRRAAATSLWIIAANAGFALVGYLRSDTPVAWGAAAVFLALSMPGMLLGQRAARSTPSTGLQRGFAALLLGIAGWTAWTAINMKT